MTESGGGATAPVRRSRLADYADMAGPAKILAPQLVSAYRTTPEAEPSPTLQGQAARPPAATAVSVQEADAQRRGFLAALETFRDTAVLVPLRDGGWLTVDLSGVRWILAFSDESALARYALARDEGQEEWTYETVLGARLLDMAVPEAGVPCGVVLDAADGAQQAVLFPPVAGIVPDAYAVNKGYVGDVNRIGGTEEQR
ncbi:hypothetical protein [Streptomyces sp. NPDC048192]|uniref:hypothetical protein n=1 Tax=Streptomyces sp. NPDC048192 TaxID=3365510 RepID=UPI0037230238